MTIRTCSESAPRLLRRLVLLAAITALSSASRAADLLVTKQGASIWIREQRTDGTLVRYVRDDGVQEAIAASDIEATVPGVKRGAKYTPAQITAALELLDTVKKSHPSLMKQVKLVEDEWRALRAPDATSNVEINEMVAAFRNGGRSGTEFGATLMRLEMARYKDVKGKFKEPIERALNEVKDTYYGVSITNLEARGSASNITTAAFTALREDALKVLRMSPAGDDKERVTNAVARARISAIRASIDAAGRKFSDKSLAGYLAGRAILDDARKVLVKHPSHAAAMNEAIAKARATVLTETSAAALSQFNGKRTLTTYLASRGTLMTLRRTVAETAADRADVDKQLERLVVAATKVFRGKLDLTYNGFPLSPADMSLLSSNRVVSSVNDLPRGTPDEIVLILPKTIPEPRRLTETFSLPATLFFNETLAPGTEFATVFTALRDGQPVEDTARLTGLQVKSGHAMVTINVVLPTLGPGAQPFESDGRFYVTLHLATRSSASAPWVPASRACRIPALQN